MPNLKFLSAVFLLPVMVVISPVYGQLASPGLSEYFTIETDGYEFEVAATSNFDITDHEFSKDEKRLTFFINSGIENNISEIQIPKNLINGNFTFYLNDEEIFPKVLANEQISFVTVNFVGDGTHKLDIVGTTYLPEFSEVAVLVLATSLFGLIILKKKLFVN